VAGGVGGGRAGHARPRLRAAAPERGYRLDDADHGRRHLALGRRRRCAALEPEQTLSPGRGVRDSADDLAARYAARLRHRRAQARAVAVRRARKGAPLMAAIEHEFGSTLLKVNDVSLSLGGKQILRDLNLEIRDIRRPGVTTGQVVGLLGPSGMGKTQLFRILAGLNKPDKGKVLLGEKGVPVERGMVGVVAQNYPLFNHRRVLGNLVLAGGRGGLSHDEAVKRARAWLARLRLDDSADKYPAQLSGGQRQRVAIAQQFMCSEHYLLLDEPFSGLDVVQ